MYTTANLSSLALNRDEINLTTSNHYDNIDQNVRLHRPGQYFLGDGPWRTYFSMYAVSKAASPSVQDWITIPIIKFSLVPWDHESQQRCIESNWPDHGVFARLATSGSSSRRMHSKGGNEFDHYLISKYTLQEYKRDHCASRCVICDAMHNTPSFW